MDAPNHKIMILLDCTISN